MHLARRASALVVGAALCGGLLASAPATGQQRAFSNPLKTAATNDLDITAVKVDATTVRITTTLTTENLGDRADAEVLLSGSRLVGETLKNYVSIDASDLGTDRQMVAGVRIADGKIVEIPSEAVRLDRTGDEISLSIDTAQMGGAGPYYVIGALSTPSGISYAAKRRSDTGYEAFGPVAVVPDPTRTRVSLSSARQQYGKGGAQMSVTTSPAVPGRVDLFAGTTRVQSASTRNGAATLRIPPSLRPGAHRLHVRFTPADALHHAPSEATAAFTVVAPARRTVTLLRLSKARQVRGKTPARAKVVVSGAPAGRVTVMDGAKKLRAAVVRNGKATIALPKNLKAGTHKIRAVFRPADPRTALGSTSKPVRLRVTIR